MKRSTILPILFMVTLTMLAARETMLPETPSNIASAISTANEIAIYWNPNCSYPAQSINWGTMSPGETTNITIYVRNEGNATVILELTTANWNPQNAPEYLYFSTTPDHETIEAKKVAEVTLTLHADPNTKNISSFSFDINFEGKNPSTPLPSDVNKDGIVDLLDLVIVARAFGSRLGDEEWNDIADIDKNGCVDLKDLVTLARDYGKTA